MLTLACPMAYDLRGLNIPTDEDVGIFLLVVTAPVALLLRAGLGWLTRRLASARPRAALLAALDALTLAPVLTELAWATGLGRKLAEGPIALCHPTFVLATSTLGTVFLASLALRLRSTM